MGKTDLMNFPEDLFCAQILTRLPLKESVRFSAVSRKWCRAWTRLPCLKFSDEFFYSFYSTPRNMRADIINKIILMQCVGLESFELWNCGEFESSIHKWLLWISLSGVKCIDLKSNGIQMEVSESIFSCVMLKSLSLRYFKMNKVPAQFKGFSELVTCYLEHVWLSDKAFEAILKLCLVLQSLTLSQCSLPSYLRIMSSSLKSLSLLRQGSGSCSVEANCPRLESIKIIECYSLIIVKICLPVCVHLETDLLSLSDFATVKSLKKITYFDVVTLSAVKVLQSFPQLQELCIEFTSLRKGVAEGTLQLANLKTLILNIGLYDEYYPVNYAIAKYDEAVLLCSCVMKGAPLLKTIRVSFDYSLETFGPYEINGVLRIVNAFQSLARDFPETKISSSWRKII